MDTEQLQSKISECLKDFYQRRAKKLATLRLRTFLRRKNPYLFRALGTQDASEIIKTILNAYISSSDETMFGDAFFEPIALLASGGEVAGATGVDLIVQSDDRILAVALKSGPNIFNSSQKKRQDQEFQQLRNRLYKIHKQFDPLLAHAYGQVKSEPTKDTSYRRRSGQAFWAEITGDPDFYLKLVRLMKDEPKKHRESYTVAYEHAVNKFTNDFFNDFCFPDGRIDWEKLVRFVSEDRKKG